MPARIISIALVVLTMALVLTVDDPHGEKHEQVELVSLEACPTEAH